MLRRVQSGEPRTYVPLLGATRHGPEPPKLAPLPRSRFHRLDFQCCNSARSLSQTHRFQAAFFDDLCRPFAAFLVLAGADSVRRASSDTVLSGLVSAFIAFTPSETPSR